MEPSIKSNLGIDGLKKLCIILALMLIMLMAMSIIQAQNEFVINLSDKIILGPQDKLVIEVYGENRVSIAYSRSPEIAIELAESLESSFQGLITLRLLNTSNVTTIKYEILFFSLKQFNLTIAEISIDEGRRILGSYVCPANVTLRLSMSLAPQQEAKAQEKSELAIPISFWSIDPWKIAVYCVFIPLFGVTAILDLKDMKRRKAGRWGLNDSIALVLRYMFYAFLLSFIAVAIGTLGMFIYSSLTAFSVDLKLGDLLTSFLLFSGLAAFYGIAKWRGWYELIDEED